ncbi:MAG: glycoside hydrolase family 31 protein [Woeseiaceae bacterium]|nr:glycoside hydrolase family 31 protein [Woeseiaceae bacterium]
MGFMESTAFDGQVIGDRVVWEGEGEVAWLEPYGKDALRFRSSKSLRIDEALDWTLLEPAPADDVEVVVDEHKAVIRNGRITGEVDGDGVVRYLDDSGEELLSEYWKDLRVGHVPNRKAREFGTIASESFAIDLYFHAHDGEHFYGLGQDANDCFDLKGSTVELCQKNTKCSIPFVYSSRGYGFLWNNPAIGRVELAANHTLWRAEAAKQIDYIVIAGDTPASVMERYTEFTGRAPVLPDWATGFWQSKLRYVTQDELLNVAREYQKRNLPISVIVADYFHWTQQGDWKFDPEFWPDPTAMVEELNEMGVKLMVSVWPTVDARSENYDFMTRRNFTLRAEKGLSAFFSFLGAQTYVDTTHPGAREFLWSRVRDNYYDRGVRMFWLDEAEPEMRPYDYDNVRYYLGNGLEVSNIYPFMFASAFWDGMHEQGEDDVVNLVRCAWLGSQRLGIVLWSGDIESSFDSLRRQVKAGLHVAMSGIPWWTTDIGGFLNGDPGCPSFRELVVRWFQFGAFCPIFRLHGYRLPYVDADFNDPTVFCDSGGPNEVWSFGDEAYEHITATMAMRERLRPYIQVHMEHASKTGTPIMRPLLFDFPADETVYGVGDQFMFGPDLMVAPVLEEGATKRTVYFPRGATWTDAESNKEYEGGTQHEMEAPLGRIPLFLKDGARLPIYE